LESNTAISERSVGKIQKDIKEEKRLGLSEMKPEIKAKALSKSISPMRNRSVAAKNRSSYIIFFFIICSKP
jgi:hypothetical protein